MNKNDFVTLFVIVVLMFALYLPQCGKCSKREDFYGGYYYPYDYPYYWPYFYSGCNENVFGEIRCMPLSYYPFW